MLHIVFHFRGNDFKGNRIPESYDHLIQAARTILLNHIGGHQDASEENITQRSFTFTFITPINSMERPIVDDNSLLEALNEACDNSKGEEDDSLVIKFLIYEKPLIPKLEDICSMERVKVINNGESHEDSSRKLKPQAKIKSIARVPEADPSQVDVQQALESESNNNNTIPEVSNEDSNHSYSQRRMKSAEQLQSPQYGFLVQELKYCNNFQFPSDVSCFVQELKLVNCCKVPWPDTTRLLLVEAQTNLSFEKEIFIGSVPPKAQVKISIDINVQRSRLSRHAFSYQLSYGEPSNIKTIGQSINLTFHRHA